MRHLLLSALAAIGIALATTSGASAQTVAVSPLTGQTYVQYYTPYTYGSNAYYYYPNTSYVYSYPYTTNYVGPTVYGPGYTANYPYMYNQLYYPYGSYYSPGYTTYRTWRGWR
jgi:hypothetical protein